MPKRWWNIGVRIEDDILVTTRGPENMSAALARTAAEVEQLMSVERGDAGVGGGER